MSTTSLHQADIRTEYYRYRVYIVPSLVLITCIVIFFQIIIPQIQNWINNQKQIADSKQKLHILNQDVSTLSNLDDTVLDNKLHIVSKALPIQKDFLGILTAVNTAGIHSGVSISDYAVQGADAETTPANTRQAVQLTLNLSGSLDAIKKFIAEIKTQLPLSDITDIKIAKTEAAITLAFFYKPLPAISFNDAEKIQILAPDEDALITTLTTYDKAVQSTDDIDTVFPNTAQ